MRTWIRRNLVILLILLFNLLLVFLFFWREMFWTVDSGHAGVVFRRFLGGTVTAYVRDEGFQVIPPWDKLIVYDVRVQQIEHAFHVISSNGLDIQVTVSIRYHPRVELLGQLHKQVGTNYVNKIVIPEVQSLIREVFGHFTPEEMYTTKRSLIQQSLQGAVGQIGEQFIVLEDLLIKSITLPPKLAAAIEAKLVEEQRYLEMEFRIQRERQDALRRVIEATGVDMAQEIIGRTLTDKLLQYKGIEATLALAQSSNAKVVVIGGRNGLPIILDTAFNQALTDTSGMTNLMSQPDFSTQRLRPSSTATNTPPPTPGVDAESTTISPN